MADLRQSEQARKKAVKKTKGGWWWVVVVLIALLANLNENGELQRLFWRFRVWLRNGGEAFAPGLFMLGVLVFAAMVVVGLVRQKKEDPERPGRTGRTSAAVQRRDPRTKSFTKPDPYCVVCDHTGEDHFRRDKASRIRQLDEWLKNGLIDKAEYKVLLSRYERDL